MIAPRTVEKHRKLSQSVDILKWTLSGRIDPQGGLDEEIEFHRGADCFHSQGSGAGIPLAQILRKHGIGQGTYYKWKVKYGGMSMSS